LRAQISLQYTDFSAGARAVPCPQWQDAETGLSKFSDALSTKIESLTNSVAHQFFSIPSAFVFAQRRSAHLTWQL